MHASQTARGSRLQPAGESDGAWFVHKRRLRQPGIDSAPSSGDEPATPYPESDVLTTKPTRFRRRGNCHLT